MSQTIRLNKGFDINLIGKADNTVKELDPSVTFAIKPSDFHGLYRPKLLVKVGDNVQAGTPLFHERSDERILYTAPVSGEIIEIVRGEKRKILAVLILADKEIESKKFQAYSPSNIKGIKKQEAKDQLLASGAWINIIQRPYGCVADPDDIPKSIFISTFDSAPLAPDYSFVLKGQETYFQTGVDILKKFTSGLVHVNINKGLSLATFYSRTENAQFNYFLGKHPMGNVGIQIHHIDPICKGEVVWTIHPIGVAQIGKLFLEGFYDTSKLVAMTGSQLKEPAYIKTYPGANIEKLLTNNTKEGEMRFISGNVLTGENVEKNGYMGYYHSQITVIPEGNKEEFLGWIKPSVNKLSFYRAFGILSFLKNKKKGYEVDTNEHGEHRNFVISGAFEKVLPMDILPTYLFKAILAQDYDEMEALGIYELIEEDVALCEFIDVSKNPLQEILREGIEFIKQG